MNVSAKSLLASFGTLVVASSPVSPDCEQAFKDFMLKYDKQYSSHEEEQKRLVIFASKYEFIKTHNALNSTYTLGVNVLADQASEEVRSTRLGFSLPATGKLRDRFPFLGTDRYSGATLPEAVDWVEKGAVTAVKNQGRCGSCWSFSTTGAIEGAWKIATNKLVSVSEQQFVDCSSDNHGCSGGSMDLAFKFAETHGLCGEAEYPYIAKAADCHASTCTTIPKGAVTGFRDVQEDSDEALMEALAKQPVSVAIEADKNAFQLYSGGVLTSNECGTNLDHGVLAVGYGEEDGTKYWKVKNSWGPTWGENGYIRLERGGATSKLGECGILQMTSYPVVSADVAMSSNEIIV
jgi:C1A family cysteine protease